MAEGEETPQNRFKFQSYNEGLKQVHLPSALDQSHLDAEIGDTQSHFYAALEHWQQLNLSPGFITFVKRVQPLSASLPLLLHNWKEITDFWIQAIDTCNDDGLPPLLDLLQKITHDLRDTLQPIYQTLLQRLLKLLTRTISPNSLTSLLATFSAVFKYLLIASFSPESITLTWEEISTVLPRCIPDIQTAFAEVWGSVLRRLKAHARDATVTLMLNDLEQLEDMVAWCFVSGCKSVSQTLHTATTSLIQPLLQYHLSCEDPHRTQRLFKRVLTALLHHVKNADQFAAVGDLLISELAIKVGADEASQARILGVLAITCSVRHGSRVSEHQLTKLLSLALELPICTTDTSLHAAIIKFLAAVLYAGDMSIWLSHGRKVLDLVWSCAEKGPDERGLAVPLVIQLHGTLADLGWGGFQMIAMPALIKRTPRLLEDDKKHTLRLLASLQRNGKLTEKDIDLVWKKKVEEWVIRQLSSWDISAHAASPQELEDVLSLSSRLSSRVSEATVGLLGKITDAFPTLTVQSAESVSSCLAYLSKRPTGEWLHLISVPALLRTSLAGASESRDLGVHVHLLSGLVALCQALPQAEASVDLNEVYPFLQRSLLSHSRTLRLCSLRLLSGGIIQLPNGVAEVVKRCLQGEEVNPGVEGVRERVLRIGRVPQLVRDESGAQSDIAIRWLLAQLKVNLRPLWSPASGALSQLSQSISLGDSLWAVLLNELQSTFSDGAGSQHPPEEASTSDSDTWEDERSWRDPSAHKLHVAVLRWLQEASSLDSPETAFDVKSYRNQLLSTCGECSKLVEKHNRELIDLFFSLNDSSSLSKASLLPWLILFSKFNNPKALYSSDRLHALFMANLSHPDRLLQTTSLNCILTYRSKALVPQEDHFRALLDNVRWREAITSFSLEEVEPHERTEVVDVIIRLLFGLMSEKKGRSGDRRRAVLGALAGCRDDELALLVDLMLLPLGSSSADRLALPYVPRPVGAQEKSQNGFLTLLADVMRLLGTRLVRYWPSILGMIIDITGGAQTALEADSAAADDQEMEPEEVSSNSFTSKRALRQLGVKRLTDFFKAPVTFDFLPYMPTIFKLIVSPRLPLLDKENTQNPSALLELFYVWATSSNHAVLLVDFDLQLLPKLFDCLVAPKVKSVVISHILDMVVSLLDLSVSHENIRDRVVIPHISLLLTNLSVLIQQNKSTAGVSDPLGQKQINILSRIAQYSTSPEQASQLLTLFTPLLRKSWRVIPEKVKVDMLKILGDLLPLVRGLSDRTSDMYGSLFQTLSHLFQSLRTRQGRLALVSAFTSLSKIDGSLQNIAGILSSLNAYSLRRLEEPDFDVRLTTMTKLNEELHCSLGPHEWQPLLYCMMQFVQDPVELSIRASASQVIRHFVDAVAEHPSPEYETTFIRMLYPALRDGLKSKQEQVRAEVLGIISYAVNRCDNISPLQDMRILLAGGDEEANFFNNIHHVQIHRRTRALRRLAELCDQQPLKNKTLNELILPLLSNYIVNPASLDHHLVNEAITTTGKISRHLNWGSYHTLVQKYIRLSRAKDEAEKVYVRTLVSLLENFDFPIMNNELQPDDIDHDLEENEVAEDNRPTAELNSIADAVNNRLLPDLLRFVELRDTTADENVRIPVAVGIVHVAKCLPNTSARAQITRLLTILSQIFKSKSLETRDLVKDTLTRIALELGPTFLPLIIHELKLALVRGPHLHIRANVTHALLTRVVADDRQGLLSLDDCVADGGHIAAEVIFGESGKDVLSEDFKTKIREVRSSSSKGLDIFSILSKHITSKSIGTILDPLRAIMQETDTLKTMQLVDDILNRISSGINGNAHFTPAELLSLCHTLVSQNSKFLQEAPRRRKGLKNDVIVEMKRNAPVERDHFSNNAHRFIVFGLDLLNTGLRRNRFNFHDAAILSRLETLVVTVGNTLYSSHTAVLTLALKCVSGLVKSPLKSMDKSLNVFITQILDIIRHTGSTEADVVQVSLRALAAIMRDSPKAQVKEKDLVFLLELISPDLEEPERQGPVFAMLRAIIARKFVVPEIYDLMGTVSEVMVTSQSPQVQEMCRSVLLQFLLDYPQGKGRLRNQMTFLAKNLSYVHESGRKSVMELLTAVISKFQDNLIWEYNDILFVALVMALANDDSPKCREMSAELIKTLLKKQNEAQIDTAMQRLHMWISQRTSPALTRVSCQVYGLVLDALDSRVISHVPMILLDLNNLLEESSQLLHSMEQGEDRMEVDVEWQTPYYSLNSLMKVLKSFPSTATDPSKVLWVSVTGHLLFPHSWVRTSACRLIGLVFAAIPVSSVGQTDFPLLAEDTPLDLAKKFCLQLKSDHLDEALGLQIVKNLLYLGKCFHGFPVPADVVDYSESDDEEHRDPAKKTNPLPWLFSTLSYQTRSAHIARRNRSSSKSNWAQQPLCILRWFAAMTAYLPGADVEKFLVHILTPVYRIVHDDTIHDAQMTELKNLAIELQDLVQHKVGATKFSGCYNQIRQGALGIQRERKATRALQATTQPELVARRKHQHNLVKKESRKRKSSSFADKRGSAKRRRND